MFIKTYKSAIKNFVPFSFNKVPLNLLFLLLLNILLYSTIAIAGDDMANAKSAGHGLGKSMNEYNSSGDKIKKHYVTPTQGGSLMKTTGDVYFCSDTNIKGPAGGGFFTLSECQSACKNGTCSAKPAEFEAKFMCQATKNLFTVQAVNFNGSEGNVAISFDLNLDGKVDYTTVTPSISGICTNGLYSCNPVGSKTNCTYFAPGVQHKCGNGTTYDDYYTCDKLCPQKPCTRVDNAQIKYVQTDIMNAGTCVCTNAACGLSFNADIQDILNYIGTSISQLISSQFDIAPSNAKYDTGSLSLVYSAIDPTKCSDLTNSSNINELKKSYQTGNIDGSSEMINQLNDPNSNLSVLMSASSGMNVQSCTIQTNVSVNNGISNVCPNGTFERNGYCIGIKDDQDFIWRMWVRHGNGQWTSTYVFHFKGDKYRICIENGNTCGEVNMGGTYFTCTNTNQPSGVCGNWVSMQSGGSSTVTASNPYAYARLSMTSDFRFSFYLEGTDGSGSIAHTAGFTPVSIFASQYYYGTGHNPNVWAGMSTNGKGINDIWAGNSRRECHLSYTGRTITLVNDITTIIDSKLKVTQNNGCLAYENDPKCKLKTEKVDGVYSVKNFNAVNSQSLSQAYTCKKITANSGVMYMVCDGRNNISVASVTPVTPPDSKTTILYNNVGETIFSGSPAYFNVEREYACTTKKEDLSWVKRQPSMVYSTLDEQNKTYLYYQDGNSSTVLQGNVGPLPQYNANCAYSCKVAKVPRIQNQPNVDTTVNEGITTRPVTSGNTIPKSNYADTEERACIQDGPDGIWNCPIKSGESIITNCRCDSKFGEAVSIFSAVSQAAKDFICSQ